MSDLETGMRTRREVLGDEHVDRATASAGPFGQPFQELITRYAWGAVWSNLLLVLALALPPAKAA